MKANGRARRLLVALPWLLLVALAAGTLLLTQDHWWAKEPRTVNYGGVVSNGSAVFRSPSGDLMVLLKEEQATCYVVYTGARKVGAGSRDTFAFLPQYAYCKHCNPPVVIIDSGKAGQDPNVVVASDAIEFTSLEGVRVRVAD